MAAEQNDSFELYDLRVEAVAPPGAKVYSGARPGDYFELRGEMLYLPPGQGFSIYSLAAVLPLLAAKQRETDVLDWMSSDEEIANPDPNCPVRLRITRTGKRRFNRSETTAVALPESAPASIPQTTLAPGYRISRLIKGGWHLSGDHGAIDRGQALRDMASFVEAGITTFDCADIYTGVEEMIGDFRAAYPDLARSVRVHTKFVPDLAELASLERKRVEASIDRSLRRLKQEALDLVQFHWWNFEIPGYVEAALELQRLQQAGKILHIGTTNFDLAHLRELTDAGVRVLSHQVQYSVLDDRPEHGMADFCQRHGIALLCYGTVAGGFLSERWLGQPEPAAPFGNRSLTKYKLIIEDFGGWTLFQELLRALAAIAHRHDCDIATVASAAVLMRPAVAAAIVGATSAAHLPAHRRIGALALDAQDLAAIEAVTSRRRGPPGDVYVLERDIEGRHGRIMKYDLHK
ncbi:aldo/keto reductase [Stenotrophomonas sp. MMGLT7]|uniref:aldo/keto reductase n=1 Tax=Stenotrophomonas sp. MMGLT7 TaxID=2901227 RepID=UPI001E4509D9|nr:TIGR04076 family protein [Stenotrophomonas sp. MMGLT7]